MKTMCKKVGASVRGAGRSFARKGRPFIVAGAAAATVSAANAQNAGVDAIVDAIEGLTPDMGTVVTAAVLLALVGIGAVAALSLAKRLMGK